ncbi:DMT family transporter [Oceanobacillus halotolerans]|uniref:DMT family transporter n=1 Tax=Oceanobacillus halotolerans TaxID=2663380 RepID=UPI0013DC0379|nr:multidrug efflux SMR transporter [Oceanobacillus halotolerans]
MAYIYLLLGVIAEVFGTTMLKLSDGFTKVLPVIGGLGGFIIALFFLALSFKSIPLSVAYATWSGLGTAGAVILSILIWKDKINISGVFGILLIITGIVLLNSIGTTQEAVKLPIEETN